MKHSIMSITFAGNYFVIYVFLIVSAKKKYRKIFRPTNDELNS